MDNYVVGMAVNNVKTRRWNDRFMCRKLRDKNEIIGVTSKGRLFYGVHDGSEWINIK